MDNIWNIIGAFVVTFGFFVEAFRGFSEVVAFIRWLVKKMSKKKLYYDVRTYKIDNKTFGSHYIHIIALWNPSFHDIAKDDVTEDIRNNMDMYGDFTFIGPNNKKLDDILKIKDPLPNIPNIDFDVFPKKSGIVFNIITDKKDFKISGEIDYKNKIKKSHGSMPKVLRDYFNGVKI